MMLNFNRRYIHKPLYVETDNEEITITQGVNPAHQISLDLEDADDLIRKIQQMKKGIMAARMRRENRELFS